MNQALQIDDQVIIPAQDLDWSAARSSGPGGQNVNKVASKVELRFDLPATTALPPAAKERLRALVRTRLDAAGRLLVVSQKTRDQGRNLEDAREKLRALVQQALVPPVPRIPTRPSRSSQRRRVEDKRQQSQRKRDRAHLGD